MTNHNKSIDKAAISLREVANIGKNAAFLAGMEAHGRYRAECYGPKDHLRSEYISLRDRVSKIRGSLIKDIRKARRVLNHEKLSAELEILQRKMGSMLELKWSDDFSNLVTTVGKNDALDKHLGGSSYTAAWYIGLIGGASYTTGVAAGDTASSHGGWVESQDYTESVRQTAAFSGASGGSKSLSSALAFSINASVTIKGCFLISNSTKGGTTGILYSAGLFTGGDKTLQNGDTLNVSYTASLT